jgi:putative sugar O-methyltransferase
MLPIPLISSTAPPRPHPVPPDPQALPQSLRERVLAGARVARATIDFPASTAVHRGLRMGSFLGTTWCLKMLVHPQWLTECRAPIPRRGIVFTEPATVSEEQLRLCERIGRAYRMARQDPSDLSPIWKRNVGRYYGALERALMAGDPRLLGEQLRWMFRRPFLAGIATPIDYEDPGAPRYWALLIYDRLASLAEAVGAVRTECPEQGPVGRVFTEGIDALPAKIEAALEISLDHPRVGAPYGILVGGRLITRETAGHLHAAVCLCEAIDTHLRRPRGEEVNVLEIGGGFAGAAMWYLRLPRRPEGSYTIIDLPLMNAFQAYFLGEVYGEQALQLFGEEVGDARIRILPPQALGGPQPLVADVVFNQDSMPEMSEQAAREYLAWMQAHVRGLFVSCNQEAAAPVGGVAQLVVAELAAELGGLTRVSRRLSWVRRGCVEEVYRCGAD